MELTFVTGNADKAKELGRMLNHPMTNQKVDISEIQSLDIEEVVTHKAQSAHQALGAPVLVEDTALSFGALGNLPGPFIKWFEKELGVARICKLLKDAQDRTATAICALAVHDGKDVHVFSGIARGTIAAEPRGNQGFGWDAIFIPEGSQKTWGEVSSKEKDKDSMRSKAITKLSEWLAND